MSLLRKVPLSCQVASLKAVPDHHRQTDFLFILDSNGNCAFWDPILGAFSCSLPANNTLATNHHIF
jgi:hypothetical protein